MAREIKGDRDSGEKQKGEDKDSRARNDRRTRAVVQSGTGYKKRVGAAHARGLL